MPTVWALQHASCETPGRIADALEAVGISIQPVLTFRAQPVPKDMGEAAGLVVMGGPMGVYEHSRYPFLLDEMRLIEQAIRQEKPVLGVCLGNQLLAAALGAAVSKGKQKEIGWRPVTLTESAAADPLWRGIESPFTAFHWHGDIFEMPRGVVRLAASDLTECQAFRYGRTVYGVLFHMEVTPGIVEKMVTTFSGELVEAGLDGGAILGKTENYLPHLQGIGALVFQRWASLVAIR